MITIYREGNKIHRLTIRANGDICIKVKEDAPEEEKTEIIEKLTMVAKQVLENHHVDHTLRGHLDPDTRTIHLEDERKRVCYKYSF